MQDLVQAGCPFRIRFTVPRSVHTGRRYRGVRGAIYGAIGIGGGIRIHGVALGILRMIPLTMARETGSLRGSTAMMALCYHTE